MTSGSPLPAASNVTTSRLRLAARRHGDRRDALRVELARQLADRSPRITVATSAAVPIGRLLESKASQSGGSFSAPSALAVSSAAGANSVTLCDDWNCFSMVSRRSVLSAAGPLADTSANAGRSVPSIVDLLSGARVDALEVSARRRLQLDQVLPFADVGDRHRRDAALQAVDEHQRAGLVRRHGQRGHGGLELDGIEHVVVQLIDGLAALGAARSSPS